MSPTKNGARAIVRVTHAAFLDMLLATAEAALVSPFLTARSFEHLATYWDEHRAWHGRGNPPLPPSLIFSETGLEVGGTLFGHVRRNGTLTEFVIERMVPTSAAIRGDDYIERSPVSVSTVANLARAGGAPFGRVLGDFHSHPLLAASIADIERERLYEASLSDLSDDSGGEIGLVMTITFSEGNYRPTMAFPRLPPSAAHVQVSDFDVWVAAYVARGTTMTSQLALDLQARADARAVKLDRRGTMRMCPRP